MDKLCGTVSYFNTSKGYGFINVVGSSDRRITTFFLHISKVERLFPETGVEVGCRVLFHPGAKMAGKEFPVATSIDVLWKSEPTPDAAGGAR